MAISKILNMKDCGGHFHGKHLKRALDYVMNPDKTQDGRLVGAINCQVDTAFEQMKETKRNFGKIDKRQGYHIILSFKENEVNPDTAFEITQKFVEEYLGKSYEAVFVVHDNTAHVHSHIVFNSVSFVDGKKYRYEKSDCYNPFSYIREETDVVKLITNLISNTTPKGSTPSDPFWEKAEGLFLQAIFYYVWLEVQPAKRNFETVLKLLGEAEVKEPGKASKLDVRMKFLEESSPLGANHPAVKQYNKCMRGAGDTVRSIIISANSRLAFLENKQVLRLLSKDELNLSDIGIGVNGDSETKTALFCVIPDSDKSYNFIIGMLYTQIFQELYYQADFNCGGRLPIHVTFMLDEFANVALPDDFCSLLSTMRSREISSIIIIQNFAQLKALFKDTWETIPGNCDTFIYLGGNEQSTHKYVSELLGKGTIDKKSSGETKGRQGSSSRNYDVLGRELFTPDEVRKLDNKKCIIFIRGFDPIMDNKYIPFRHPMFNQTADGKGKAYVHKTQGADRIIGPPFEILSEKAIKHYEKMKDKGENVYIDTLTYEQFMLLGDKELSRRFSMQDEAEQKAKIDREQANEFEYADESQKAENSDSTNGGEKPVRNPEREKPKWEDTITNRMMHWSYTAEQKEEVKKALAAGVPKATILTYFYPEVTVEKMSSYRKEQ